MEDAMIINKSAYERGFGHGTVYKSYLRDLNEGSSTNTRSKYRLVRKSDHGVEQSLEKHGLDTDGLPFIGMKMEHGQAD
jgi:DNA-directed RNA polymerase I subunit RPA2